MGYISLDCMNGLREDMAAEGPARLSTMWMICIAKINEIHVRVDLVREEETSKS